MERYAVDSTGQPEYFYDIVSDRVIASITDDTSLKHILLDQQPVVELISSDQTSTTQLLEAIGIEPELRLSLLLKLAESTGIASILNHQRPFDEYTRILRFSWRTSRVTFQPTSTMGEKWNIWWQLPPEATHRISAVTYGIDFLLVLHSQPDRTCLSSIDTILDRIRTAFVGNRTAFEDLTKYQTQLFEMSLYHGVYSNVPNLRPQQCIINILNLIDPMKNVQNDVYPVKYHLEPMKSNLFQVNIWIPLLYTISFSFRPRWLAYICGHPYFPWYSLPDDLIETLSNRLAQQHNMMKTIQSIWNNHREKIREHSEEEYNGYSQELFDIERQYQRTVNTLKHMVIDARDDPQTLINIEIFLESKQIKELIDRTRNAYDMMKKSRPIRAPSADAFEWQDSDCHTGDSERIIDQNASFSCQKISEKKKKLKTSKTQTTLESNHFVAPPAASFQSPTTSDNLEKSSPLPTVRPASPEKPHICLDLGLPESAPINVLLIGQSGVGKSTFINAIANYLRFSSLEDAMQEPIVIIPVSFLITTGSNFDEKVLYFGECRNRDNENFNDEGQSVTQECQEYEFDVPFQGGTKRIQIIDTPGLSDTRGIAQDQKNIASIKSYIQKGRRLSGICYLMKPNESRSNVSFRVAFKEYAASFGEEFQRKLLFCFTNARSTFYSPGDTAPILKTLLSEIPSNKITMRKENTFCLDNESFRYLVARRNGILFNEDDEREYNESWKRSVAVARRLLTFILQNDS